MPAEAAEGISQGLVIGFSLLSVFALGIAGVAFWQKNFALAIGVAVATAVHAGVLAFHSEPAKKAQVQQEEEKVELVELPPLEPEEDIEVVENEADEAPPEFAPPQIMDLPSTVPVSAMQIKFEPPPPEAPRSLGTITIPSNRQAPGAGWGKLFELKDLDQKPTPITRIQPTYPFEMKRAGQNGNVLLGFIVDSTGTVRDAYVVDSSHREFEAAALQAIQKWKFRPGKKGGRAVNTKMQQPIVFNISN
jgi:periplasmic protein TonB